MLEGKIELILKPMKELFSFGFVNIGFSKKKIYTTRFDAKTDFCHKSEEYNSVYSLDLEFNYLFAKSHISSRWKIAQHSEANQE